MNQGIKVFLRGDGNEKIGFGHLYRLYALYHYLKNFFNIEFVISNETILPFESEVSNILKLPKFKFKTEEISYLKQKCKANDWLILDGYQFELSYEKEIRDLGVNILKIDDFCSATYANVIVNQDPNIELCEFKNDEINYPVIKKTGTSFALLRPGFISAISKPTKINENGEIFISFGGADPKDLGLNLAQKLSKMNLVKKIHWLGSETIAKKINNNFPEKVIFYNRLSDVEIIKVLRMCQLACLPCSNIFQEACCVGIPIICGYFVDNQEYPYYRYKKENLFYPIEDWVNAIENDYIVDIIEEKLNNFNLKIEIELIKNQKILFNHDFALNYKLLIS